MKSSYYQRLDFLLILLLVFMVDAASATVSEPQCICLSRKEGDAVMKHTDVSYAYLGEELSDIAKVTKQISKLFSHEKLRGISELCNHLRAGYKIGCCDAVIEVLSDALDALGDNSESETFFVRLKDNIEQLQNNALTIEVVKKNLPSNKDVDNDTILLEQLQVQGIPIVIEEEGIARDPEIDVVKNLSVGNDTLVGRNLTVENDLLVKDRLEVLGKSEFKKATFKKDVQMDDDLKVKDKLTVSGKAEFKKNTKFKKDVEIGRDLFVDEDLEVLGDAQFDGDVKVEGNLSVQDELVVCGEATFKSSVDILGELKCLSHQSQDMAIDNNISLNDTNSPRGNIYKNGVRFIHNYGKNNTFVGKKAGNFSMTGEDNSGFGFSALSSNTTGDNNTAVGSRALEASTTGESNTGIGARTLKLNTAGNSNVAVGPSSLYSNTTGNINVAVGTSALFSNTTGSANIAVGTSSLSHNTTGSDNVAVGVSSLDSNTEGSSNIAVGRNALRENTTGDCNTAVGKKALVNNEEGNRNIGVGCEAGISLTNGSDNIYIGSDAGLSVEDATIRIGGLNTQTDCYIQGIHGAVIDSLTDLPVFVDADGKLGTTTSSKRYKTNIIDMGTFSDSLMNLRPILFSYNHDTSHKTHCGLLAEEVAEICPELIVRDKSGNIYSVRYHELPAMLLNELQKQQKTIKEMQNKDAKNLKVMQALKKYILMLVVRLNALEESAQK